MASDFYVYVLFRPWDGSPFYVGKGSGARFGWHLKKSSRKRSDRTGRILMKADALGLEIPALKIREGLLESEANEIEIALISVLGRAPNGLLSNLTEGGEGARGRVYSDAAREKIKISMAGNKNGRGNKLTPEMIERLRAINKARPRETIERISAALRGRKLTDEHRAKLSAAKKGKKQDPDLVERRASANRGKKRSVEAKSNMSAGQIGNKNGVGRVVTPEVRARIGAATKARWEDPEGRQKLLASMGLA